MCCYLYAAFSLKRTEPRWSSTQRDAVERWRRTIMPVPALRRCGQSEAVL